MSLFTTCLPVIQLHSTDETIVWRDLEPVYHLFTSDSITLSQAVTHVSYAQKSTARAKRAIRNVKNDKTTLNKSEVEEGVKYD